MAVDNLHKKLFDNEVELNSIIDLEVQGIITRSRAQWTEDGERSTKYFFGLEKSNGKKKSISNLRYILYFLISVDLSTIKLFTHDLEFHLVFVCKRMQDHYKTIKQFRFITWLLS